MASEEHDPIREEVANSEPQTNEEKEYVADDDFDKKSEEELKAKMLADDIEFMKRYEDCTLDDLFSYGYITHTVKISDNHEAVIRTLLSGEDKQTAKKLGDYSGVNMYVKAENADDILQFALVRYNNLRFDKPEDVRTFVNDKMSIGVKTLLLYEFSNLMKALALLLKGPGSENPLVAPLSGIGLNLG